MLKLSLFIKQDNGHKLCAKMEYKNNMQVRVANKIDINSINKLYIDAFSKDEGLLLGKLVADLIANSSVPNTLSYVVEDNAKIIAHISFSPIFIESNLHIKAYILAPLAVKPNYKRQGIGSKLIVHGKQELIKLGVNVILVYGDPNYYNNYGFTAKSGEYFIPPFPIKQKFGWQAMILDDFILTKNSYKFSCVTALNDPKYW